MTTLAILGAASQIARDFIRQKNGTYDLFLFSRAPSSLQAWLNAEKIQATALDYAAFGQENYEVILNFVGVGDPARAAQMGAAIFDVTHQFDSIALDYLRGSSGTRYIFLSSGAVYGTQFLQPADLNTAASIPVNALTAQDYYSVAKLHAEARHRAAGNLPVVDIRVFNYFSRTIDITQRFFITDMLRTVLADKIFETSEQTMQRDFLIPPDFCALVTAILKSAPRNIAVDAYSSEPIEKFALLEAMHERFGLQYRVVPSAQTVQATGAKPAYFSKNRRASEFGYTPQFSSLAGVLQESAALLDNSRR